MEELAEDSPTKSIYPAVSTPTKWSHDNASAVPGLPSPLCTAPSPLNKNELRPSSRVMFVFGHAAAPRLQAQAGVRDGTSPMTTLVHIPGTQAWCIPPSDLAHAWPFLPGSGMLQHGLDRQGGKWRVIAVMGAREG